MNSQPIAANDVVRVVLIDDDPAVRSALAFAFGVDGFNVESYDSAESLLSAPAIQADCLIIDQRLPGQSGLDLFAELRSRGCRTPAVLITSYPNARLHASAASMGIDVIEKPLLSDALPDAVRAAVGRQVRTVG